MKRTVQHSYPWLSPQGTIEFNITASVGPNPPGRISGPTNECFDAVVDFFGTKNFSEIALEEPTIMNSLFISLVATTMTKWVRKNTQNTQFGFPYRKISITSLIASYGQVNGDLVIDIDCMFRR